MEMDNDIFVLDSTIISLSFKLWSRTRSKRSREAIKVHTLSDLRGNIPTFIYISDGKYHDVYSLDEIEIIPNAIYVFDKAYASFKRLNTLNEVNSFFVVQAKDNFRFKVIESRKADKSIDLRCDQTIKLVI